MKKLFSFTFILLFIALNAMSQNNKQMPVVMNHQAIYVKDLKAAATFYTRIIGLEQVDEPFKIGKHAWFKTGDKTTLHIIAGAAETKTYYKNHHMCFTVPSLEAFIKKLDKNKIPYEDANGKKAAITHRVDGVQQLWIQDPDGYWIEINNDPVMYK